jgi:hypothetical protein
VAQQGYQASVALPVLRARKVPVVRPVPRVLKAFEALPALKAPKVHRDCEALPVLRARKAFVVRPAPKGYVVRLGRKVLRGPQAHEELLAIVVLRAHEASKERRAHEVCVVLPGIVAQLDQLVRAVIPAPAEPAGPPV